jgi:hypothetical protein
VDKEDEIKQQVKQIVALQQQLDNEQDLLAQDERFARFLKMQQEYTAKIGEFWKSVEETMISNDIKNVKGEWGYVTIADRDSFNGDIDELPRKFVKRTVDVAEIGKHYKLTGKLPKGATIKHTKYLTKKIKT